MNTGNKNKLMLFDNHKVEIQFFAILNITDIIFISVFDMK